VVEWDVEVISRVLFLLKWEVSAPELDTRPTEWKGFFRAAVNLTMPLEVTTRSGRKQVAQCVYPKGFPQNPMSDADVEAKFRSCCAELLTAQQCDRALELLWSLEAQPNLKELFDNLIV
jgi:2-methylcitrate dehydratase PrpD